MRVVREPSPAEVVIVASSRDTLSGLQSYLRAAGMSARGTSELDELPRLIAAGVTAFVIFPDDFRSVSVLAALDEASAGRRQILSVLVTAHPKRFEGLTRPRGDGVEGAPPRRSPPRRRDGALERRRVLIVPRPAWGWTILDVLRAHANGQLGSNTDT